MKETTLQDTAFLSRLQEEMVEWQAHNFPGRPAHQPLLGIGEELGEMIEAGNDRQYDKMADAVADTIIFAADYCSAVEWRLDVLWADRTTRGLPPSNGEFTRLYMIALGRLNHAHLKREQGIRGDASKHEEAGQLALRQILGLFDVTWPYGRGGRKLLDVVAEVWEQVRARDWQKHRAENTVPADTVPDV